jgi:hypothetical protein
MTRCARRHTHACTLLPPRLSSACTAVLSCCPDPPAAGWRGRVHAHPQQRQAQPPPPPARPQAVGRAGAQDTRGQAGTSRECMRPHGRVGGGVQGLCSALRNSFLFAMMTPTTCLGGMLTGVSQPSWVLHCFFTVHNTLLTLMRTRRLASLLACLSACHTSHPAAACSIRQVRSAVVSCEAHGAGSGRTARAAWCSWSRECRRGAVHLLMQLCASSLPPCLMQACRRGSSSTKEQ